MKPQLNIFHNNFLVDSIQIDRLKEANEYVQNNHKPGLNYVFSTFNGKGIENTIKIKKIEL